MPARLLQYFSPKSTTGSALITLISRSVLVLGLSISAHNSGWSETSIPDHDLLVSVPLSRADQAQSGTIHQSNAQPALPNHKNTKQLSVARLPAAAEPLPNDPFAPDQWNFMTPDQFAGAANIFNPPDHNRNLSRVVVAVVDSGMLLDHEDYLALPGYDFVHDPDISNDGDGRDNDPTDPGDWVSTADLLERRVSENCQPTPSKWHGTAIAGIIGAESGNNLGVAGGSDFVSLLPVRVTGKCGGYVNDLIDGIRWAAGLSVSGAPDNPYPARIINLSVGFPGQCSHRLQTALDDAVKAGAILVTASTNNGVSLDTNPYSPATCDNVLSIGATLRNGEQAEYSSYGSNVFLLSPGGSARDGIVTTDNRGRSEADPASSYGYHFGTSMAAAHVSAALATLLTIDPSLSNQSLAKILSVSATPHTTDTRCNSSLCGHGLLNTNRAIQSLLNPEPQNDNPAYLIQNQSAAPGIAAVQSAEAPSAGSTHPAILFLLLLLTCKNRILTRLSRVLS